MYSIYIPLIKREVQDLEFLMSTWKLNPPIKNANSNNVDLYISFDQEPGEELRNKCSKMFLGFNFRKVEVISANLCEKEAIYIRHGCNYDVDQLPKFGCKSGPNMHFFFNQKFMHQKGYIATLQCETDMFPLEPYWVDKIFNNVSLKKVISGPIYRGPTRLGGRILRHVNGNSVYITSNKYFPAWLDIVEKSTLYLINKKKVYSCAFDTALFELIHAYEQDNKISILSDLNSKFIETEDDLRLIISLIDYSDLILNFSGGSESSEKYPINIESIINKYSENCILIHSPHARYYFAAKILADKSLNASKFIKEYVSNILLNKDKKLLLYKKYIEPSEFIRKSYAKASINPFLWRI